MSENHMQLLGWGIMGTPKGRQQVNAGSNSQLDVSYDLPQDIGVCLPNPSKTSEFIPLYCLKRRVVGNNHSLGLAEYFPIFEQGQTRAGTYFGAFVNVVNASIATEKLELWLETVRELSLFQTQHFIDVENKVYRHSITGQKIDAPMTSLQTLAQFLRPLPENQWKEITVSDNLYVHCGKGKVQETLALLLQLGLFYRYSQIFFSESEWISQQMRGKKIEQMSSEQLAIGSFWLEPYQKVIHNQKVKIKEMTTDLNHLRHNQQQLVDQQVNQVKVAYQQELQKGLK